MYLYILDIPISSNVWKFCDQHEIRFLKLIFFPYMVHFSIKYCRFVGLSPSMTVSSAYFTLLVDSPLTITPLASSPIASSKIVTLNTLNKKGDYMQSYRTPRRISIFFVSSFCILIISFWLQKRLVINFKYITSMLLC